MAGTMKKRPDFIPHKLAALPAGTIGTRAAAHIVGMHWRSLLRWIDRGALAPELFTGEARTTSAGYAWRIQDVTAARTIAELRAAGLSAQRIRKAVAAVLRYGRPLSAVRLWTDGYDAFEVGTERQLTSLVMKGGQVEVFRLDEWADTMRREFRAELEKRRA